MRIIYFTFLAVILASCGAVHEQHTSSSPECNYEGLSNKTKNKYTIFSKKEYNSQQNYRYREYSYSKDLEFKEDSDTKYTLYNKPNDYTGYYKIGKPYRVMGRKYYPKCNANYEKVGVASWYGEKFYGKKTANGETYNMYDMTAAHTTLPLPSVVKVTNLQNGKTVKVRVNDRGPFVGNRIIDLSKEAAKRLGFMNNGTAKVKVEFLPEETEAMLKNFGFK